MKIVDLDRFLLLPNGILFFKYVPNSLEELCIKRQSLLESKDFCYSTLVDGNNIPEKLNTTFHVDITSSSRDGCFDDDQLFAVWEKHDIEQLQTELNSLLSNYPKI